MSIAIIWGSSTGYTEEAARAIATQLGSACAGVFDVASTPLAKVASHDVLLIGCPTWNVGELQEDWADRIAEIDKLDFSGRKVGFFGCGDAHGYPDTFQDALGMLWERFEARGASLVGKWSTQGYEFEDSRALCDGRAKFVGLALDQESQPGKTPERIRAWVTQLKSELGLS